MSSIARYSTLSLGIAALFLSAAASADGKPATRVPLAEDERLQAFEIRQKPGEVNTPSTTGYRVIRAMQGGTLTRTYADGKTETAQWATGEVQIQGPGPQYTVTNTGDTEVVLYVVRPK